MKKENEGFIIPSEIWHSKDLNMNAKFVACCLIEYFERLGIKAHDRLPEHECKITDKQLNEILNRNEIGHKRFFTGLTDLRSCKFISKLIVSDDGLITIKTHF